MEIKNSLYFLENGLNLDKTYCHPYGGFHTFNKETIKILAEEAIGYSFNVEPRDIFENDIINSPYYLPDMIVINLNMEKLPSYNFFNKQYCYQIQLLGEFKYLRNSYLLFEITSY